MERDTSPRPGRWRQRLLISLVAIAILLAGSAYWLLSPSGQSWLIGRIQNKPTQSGFAFSIGKVTGSLFSTATIEDIHFKDPQGDFLIVHRARVAWNPRDLARNTITIDTLDVLDATWLRLPRFRPGDPTAPLLPDQDIHIGKLNIAQLRLASALAGAPYTLTATGDADIQRGTARVQLDTAVAGTSDHARVRLLSEPDKNKFDLDLDATASPAGPLARIAHLPRGFTLKLAGRGDYAQWKGNFVGTSAQSTFADFSLVQRDGKLTLTGRQAPLPDMPPVLQTVIRNLPDVRAAVQLDRRVITTSGTASSAQTTLSWNANFNAATSQIKNATANFNDPAGALVRELQPALNSTGVALSVSAQGPRATPAFTLQAKAAALSTENYSITAPNITLRSNYTTGKLLYMSTASARNMKTGLPALDTKLQTVSLTATLRSDANSILADAWTLAGSDLKASGTAALDQKTRSWRAGVDAVSTTLATAEYGRLPVQGSAKITRNSPTDDIRISALTSIDLAAWRGPPQVRTLMGRTAQLKTELSILKSGRIQANPATLSGNGTVFSGSADIASGQLHGVVTGTIANVQTLIPPGPLIFSGNVPVRIVVDGPVDAPRISVDTSLKSGTIGGLTLSDIQLGLRPITNQRWQATLKAGAPLGPVVLTSLLGYRTNEISLSELQGKVGDIAVGGNISIAPAALVTGKITIAHAVQPQQLNGGLQLSVLNNQQMVAGTLRATQFRSLWNGAPLSIDSADAAISGTTSATAPLTIAITARDIQRNALQIKKLQFDAAGSRNSLRAKYEIAGQRGAPFELKGTIARTAKPNATAEITTTLTGVIAGQSLAIQEPARFSTTSTAWILEPATLNFSGGSATLSAQGNGRTTSADVALNNANLSLLQIFQPALAFTGTASGRAKLSVEGTKLTSADGNLSFRKFRRTGVFLSSAPISADAQFNLRGGALSTVVKATANGAPAGDVQLRILPDATGDFSTARLEGAARWDGPAEALYGLIGTDANDIRGPLIVSAQVSGRVNQPDARGTISMRGGRYENIALGLIVTGVEVQGEFTGPKLTIGRARGILSAGGSIDGTGNVDLSIERGLPTLLDLTLTRAAIVKRDDIEAVVSGPVQVTYGPAGGKITGKIKVDRARLRAGTPTADAIAELDVRETNRPQLASGPARTAISAAKPIALDLAVSVPEKLFISGLGLNSEWAGALTVTGTTRSPRVLGRMQILRGEYLFAGKRFTVDRGELSFQGTTPVNPVIAVQASARAGNSTAVIRVAGTALRPNIAFSAEPSLPQDEILARLLFGTSVDSLSALEAVQLAAALNQLGSASGGLNVLGSVKRLTGIDRLRVLPADATTGRSAALSGGRYLTDRIFLEVATDGRGYTATTIEIDVTRTLSILSQIATLGGQSVGVKWSKDY